MSTETVSSRDMGIREEKKRRTRHAIMSAALTLYREVGYDRTRVHDVVERVGVSEKTFFNYFSGKQAVLEAHAEDVLGMYEALLAYELGRPDVPVEVRLGEIVSLWGRSFSEDRELNATLVTKTPFFFGSSDALADRQRRTQQLLATLLEQGQERGEIRPDPDPAQMAEVLTASLLLTTTNWLISWWGEPDEGLEQRLARALEIFLGGAAP